MSAFCCKSASTMRAVPNALITMSGGGEVAWMEGVRQRQHGVGRCRLRAERCYRKRGCATRDRAELIGNDWWWCVAKKTHARPTPEARRTTAVAGEHVGARAAVTATPSRETKHCAAVVSFHTHHLTLPPPFPPPPPPVVFISPPLASSSTLAHTSRVLPRVATHLRLVPPSLPAERFDLCCLESNVDCQRVAKVPPPQRLPNQPPTRVRTRP
jgi:hypothetical protein